MSELRREAHNRGLDVDGSREALISALESIDKLKPKKIARVET